METLCSYLVKKRLKIDKIVQSFHTTPQSREASIKKDHKELRCPGQYCTFMETLCNYLVKKRLKIDKIMQSFHTTLQSREASIKKDHKELRCPGQ
jgi:uncharacterized Zn-finger protein